MLKKLIFYNFLLYLTFLSPSVFAITLNDNGRISTTHVAHLIHVKTEKDILEAIQDAIKDHHPIAIMGQQHSQGGQTLAENAIQLDMLSFNKVISMDLKKKQITVQSGILWGDLQKVINPYNLAILSMQSPNIFTVGGSISVNAHGDDFRSGAVGNSVVKFHMLLANGEKILVSKSTNPRLWSAVVGGYGLFGVITDVTLQLTDNDFLMSHYEETTLDDFPKYFNEYILKDPNIKLFYAHVNIVPGSDFLKNMYVITYADTNELPKKIIKLDNPDKWNVVLKPVFNMSRKGERAKSWRFALEREIFSKRYNHHIVTRNNAMEKPVRFASDYRNKSSADWLQEYFIAPEKLPEFISKLSDVVLKNKINLLNLTIRYVPAEKEMLLPYASHDSFAIVLYFNQHLAVNAVLQAKAWTRELINYVLSINGNYYLPYQNFASLEEFKSAYPGYKKVIELKKIYDPKNIFSNRFYQKYFLDYDSSSAFAATSPHYSGKKILLKQ